MPHKPTRILGLDPGFARTGYAVLESDGRSFRVLTFGCVETASSEPYPVRLRQLNDQLGALIAEFTPAVAALEKLFFQKNVKTAIAVGQARGVIILLLERHNLATYEFTPQEVKIAATGYGNAEKQQVQRMVQLLLRLATPPTPDDAADALAVALAAAERHRAVLASNPKA
ncbi:MAG: crossover junction endodeoxyribonuclease RuvC [Candidatus Kerfeldbacteria bacterium]|nr:crossover junction endodeoxyribonuclease RuvC [Candidatus Kerfeldbacteria bacterium]